MSLADNLQRLVQHPHITHFELRPLDRAGAWQLSYRDHLTSPPAYSGACKGTLHDVVLATLTRADSFGVPEVETAPPPKPTKKSFRRVTP